MNQTKLALAVLLILFAGCAESPKSDPIVPIDQVPPKLMEIAREKSPGYTFDTVYKSTVDGKEAYLIRGKNKQGKIREVEISAAGEVLEIE